MEYTRQDKDKTNTNYQQEVQNLLKIIYFTETISTKIHGLKDEIKIYQNIIEGFAKSKYYNCGIYLLIDDEIKLKIVGTSTSSSRLKKVEKAAGLQCKKFKIDLNKQEIYRQVAIGGKTIYTTANETMKGLFPQPLIYLISKTLGYEKEKTILTPLYKRGKIIGVFAMSAPEMAEYFIPCAKNFVRQISTNLELADDYAERKRAEEEIKRGKERAEEYLNTAGVMLAAVNADENITMINKKGCEILEYQEEELIGSNWFDLLVPKRIRGEIREVFCKLMAGDIKPVEYYEDPLLTKSKEERFILFHNTVIRGSKGQITGVLFSGEDITERKRTEEILREQAIHDPLTGIYNRYFFNEIMDKEVKRSKRYGHSLDFLMVDVNRFKEINDRYSHLIGDKILQEVANLIKRNIREADTLVRYGGDEFLILLPQANEELNKVINRIRDELKKWNERNDLVGFPLTLAIGTFRWSPKEGREVKEAIKEADLEMYKDKQKNMI